MSIYNRLYTYQRELLDSISDKKSIGLGMDTGTGKTITALAKLDQLDPEYTLIVCLVSKIDDWYEEILDQWNVEACKLDKGTKRNIALLEANEHDIYIISFDSVWRLKTQFNKIIDKNWLLLVDESQKIKSPKSKVTKYMLRLSKKTDMKMLLSGLPNPEGYDDYYTQLKFLGMNMSYNDWRDRFIDYQKFEINGFPVYKILGYINVPQLRELIETYFVFMDINDALDLPGQVFEPIRVDMNPNYKIMEEHQVIGDYKADNLGVYRLYLRQLASGFIGDVRLGNEKQKAFAEWIEGINTRVIVMYNFNVELEMIMEACEKLGKPYSLWNGSEKDRTAFDENENGVLIGHYRSAATGLNLQNAHVMALFSPPEAYNEYYQALARIYRNGQTQRCVYVPFLTKESMDEEIYHGSLLLKSSYNMAKFKEAHNVTF